MGLKVIITGVTGMVGEGVLLESIQNSLVEKILIIARKKYEIDHPRVEQIILTDFFNVESIKERLAGFDACYFCAGVSSLGMKEDAYRRITYDLTMLFAKVFAEVSPNAVFCYLSGAGTDSSEKGKLAWARIKGKLENDLAKLPFKAEYNFRPGFMKPTKGAKNTLSFYNYVTWLYPIAKSIFPNSMIKLSDLGKAMINVTLSSYNKNVLEVKDIIKLSGN